MAPGRTGWSRNTLEEAHRVLADFLPRHNGHFGVPAAQEGSAYRPLLEGLDLERVLCFHYQRTVGPDNVVRFGGHRLQILPTNGRTSYARARGRGYRQGVSGQGERPKGSVVPP